MKTKAQIKYYFSNDCAPCKALRPKIQEMVQKEFPKIELILIDGVQKAKQAADDMIFSFPTLIFTVDSKEYFRGGVNHSVSEIQASIKRVYNLAFD